MSGYGAGRYGTGRYGGGRGSDRQYSDATEDAYARLPDLYREADTELVLKRWLSALFDQVGLMREIRERLDLDPARADATKATGELLTRSAAGLPVTGTWTAVPVAGGVGLRTTGPAPAFTTWDFKVAGGVYALQLSYEAGPDRGLLRLEVDGVLERTVDLYSPTPTAARGVQVIASVPLSRGFHTLRAHWTGAKRAASSGTSVVIAGFGLVNLSGLALDSSDLVDPSTADDAWLNWLAQLVGITLRPELDAAQRRDAVRQGAQLRAGSRAHLESAVRTVLTGGRSVEVRPHTRVESTVAVDSGPWDLTIVTNAGETPGGSASVLEAVRRLDAKPAGVRLFHTIDAGTWGEFHARFPTWAALQAMPTWTTVHDESASAPPPPPPPPNEPPAPTTTAELA